MALSEEPKAGSLYAMEKDLSVTKKISGVTISNGLAWSPDHQTMYYIDTPTSEIVSYRYEKSTGRISERTVIIKIPGRRDIPME